MAKYEPAKILFAIGMTMTCERCPYPCGNPNSSMASCVNYLFDVVSGAFFDEADKRRVLDGVFEEFSRNT